MSENLLDVTSAPADDAATIFNDDALVDIEFANLPIRADILKNIGLWRVPSWEEVFLAIFNVVDPIEGGLFQSGAVAIPIPEKGVGGRCFLYAGATWAFMSMLFDNVPTGAVVGGVSIQSTIDPNCKVVLPKEPGEPQPFSGGYHAWAFFVHDNEEFMVDMQYFWFRQTSSAVGPRHFIAARRTNLERLGIVYYPNAALTSAFALGEDIKLWGFILNSICVYLRQIVGKPPARYRLRKVTAGIRGVLRLETRG